jgi:hypothetical protein
MDDERSRPRERGKRRYEFLIPVMHGEPPQSGGLDTKEYTVVKPFFWSRRKARVLQGDDLALYEPAAVALPGSLSKIHLTATQAAELSKEGLVRREGCTSARTRRRVRLLS